MNNACKGAFRKVDKPMTPSIVQIVASPLARASKTPAQNCENQRAPSGPNAGPLRRSDPFWRLKEKAAIGLQVPTRDLSVEAASSPERVTRSSATFRSQRGTSP